jgi:hypothetical protein
LDREEAHFSVINIVRIPGLLFPDDLAIACSQVRVIKEYCTSKSVFLKLEFEL